MDIRYALDNPLIICCPLEHYDTEELIDGSALKLFIVNTSKYSEFEAMNLFEKECSPYKVGFEEGEFRMNIAYVNEEGDGLVIDVVSSPGSIKAYVFSGFVQAEKLLNKKLSIERGNI